MRSYTFAILTKGYDSIILISITLSWCLCLLQLYHNDLKFPKEISDSI